MVRERGGNAEVVVPPTIQALLQARLDLLPDDERTVIGHAAVEGQVFHRGSVAELVPGRVLPELDTQLSSLVRKELIRPETSMLPGEEAFRFRHLLIREAAYSAMPKELRAKLHERLAEWLERSATGSLFELDEILGYHLEQAYRFRHELGWAGEAEQALAGRAAARLLAAGQGAFARADLSATIALLRRGIELLPEGDPARLEALRGLASAHSRRGELGRAEEVLRSALGQARVAGNARVEALARLSLGSIRTRTDPEARTEDELAEAIEIAASMEKAGDLSALAQAHNRIGLCRFMLGRAGEGEADLREAAELARRGGDAVAEREALSSRLRPVAWGPTPAADGIAFCDFVLQHEGANIAHKAHALQVRALLAAMQGDFELSRDSASRAWAIIEEFGLNLQHGIYAIDVGVAVLLEGEDTVAERTLRAANETLAGVGETGARATLVALLADLVAKNGSVDEAARFAEESRAIASTDDLDAQGRWRPALARVLSRRGDHSAAERLVREADALLEPTDFIVLHAHVCDVLGDVLERAGRVDEACDAVDRAIGLHEQKGNVVSAGRSRSVLGELRAARPS